MGSGSVGSGIGKLGSGIGVTIAGLLPLLPVMVMPFPVSTGALPGLRPGITLDRPEPVRLPPLRTEPAVPLDGTSPMTPSPL